MPLATTSLRSQSTGCAAGRRENCENSSTSRFTEAVSSRMVPAHSRSRCVHVRRAGCAVQLAQNAFGRKRDGRQRIPDLMRDAPRHFAPCRRLLRAQQVAGVFDDDDEAGRCGRRSTAATVTARCSVLRGVLTSSCWVASPVRRARFIR